MADLFDAPGASGLDARTAGLDAWGLDVGGGDPSVNRDLCYMHNTASADSVAIESWDWYTGTLVDTFPRPTSDNPTSAYVVGSTDTVFYRFIAVADSLARYYVLDPSDMAVVSGPHLSPNGDQISGIGGTLTNVFVGSVTPNNVWRNGTLIAENLFGDSFGGTVWYDDASDYLIQFRGPASTDDPIVRSSTDWTNLGSVAGITNAVCYWGANYTGWESLRWGRAEASPYTMGLSNHAGFGYANHTGFGTNQRMATDFQNALAEVTAAHRSGSLGFLDGPATDCGGGSPRDPSFTDYRRFEIETEHPPYSWAKAGSTISSSTTSLETFLIGPNGKTITIPAHSADIAGTCYYDIDGNGTGTTLVKIEQFDTFPSFELWGIRFTIYTRKDVGDNVDFGSVGTKIKVRSAYL